MAGLASALASGALGSEIVADVYRMGSLLNAFGIWSNYRKADAPKCDFGGDCTRSSSQLLFYQDRYFVRLQATGTPPPPQDAFLACGRALSRNLPPGKGRPGELELVNVRGITAGLLMLGRQRAVEVMERVGRALAGIVRPEPGAFALPRLDRLADAIVAVEYYMEMLQAGRPEPWRMLDHAEESLASLEPATAAVHVFVRGREADLSQARHRELARRYAPSAQRSPLPAAYRQ